MNKIEISLTNNIDHQHDSTGIHFDTIKTYFMENLADIWKYLARELDVNENDIDRISKENISLKEKFSLVSLSLEQKKNKKKIFGFFLPV